MRPVTISKVLAAASANNIALSQSRASAGLLTMNGAAVSGGVATLDTQRRVLITSAGTDTGITFTITGTNQSGALISEVVPGGSSGTPAQSVLDFLTVASVRASGATAAAVTVGTSAVGSTPWANVSISITPFSLPVVTVVNGSVTYSLETTADDFWTPVQPTQATPVPGVQSTIMKNATTASDITLSAPVTGWRLTVSAGTGSVTATGIQAGIVNY